MCNWITGLHSVAYKFDCCDKCRFNVHAENVTDYTFSLIVLFKIKRSISASETKINWTQLDWTPSEFSFIWEQADASIAVAERQTLREMNWNAWSCVCDHCNHRSICLFIIIFIMWNRLFKSKSKENRTKKTKLSKNLPFGNSASKCAGNSIDDASPTSPTGGSESEGIDVHSMFIDFYIRSTIVCHEFQRAECAAIWSEEKSIKRRPNRDCLKE